MRIELAYSMVGNMHKLRERVRERRDHVLHRCIRERARLGSKNRACVNCLPDAAVVGPHGSVGAVVNRSEIDTLNIELV